MNRTYTPDLPPDVLQRLDAYAAQFRPNFPRARPARWAGVYLRGLIQDSRRKSIEPMARRLALPPDLQVADPLIWKRAGGGGDREMHEHER